MSAIQATAESYNGIENPLVSCNECHAVWHSVKCERCPLCGQNVGVLYILSDQQKSVLLSAVNQLNKERIARASEYETWAFGEILRKNVPWYEADCRRTIQACYLTLLRRHEALIAASQPRTLTKVAFAMKFFEEAYLVAPEDPMMYKQEDEDEEDQHDSDVDEWW